MIKAFHGNTPANNLIRVNNDSILIDIKQSLKGIKGLDITGVSVEAGNILIEMNIDNGGERADIFEIAADRERNSKTYCSQSVNREL